MPRPVGLAMGDIEEPAPLVTVDEFHALIGDGQKADLINGIIYMASPDSLEANDLNAFLCFLMRGYVAARNLGGKVFVSRFAFELSEIRAPEPDVAYVRPERMELVEHRGMRGGPDIAVEIVSRESRTRDYEDKKQLYLEAGVGEYWLVDPLARRVEFWRLDVDRYELVPLERNRIFRSEVLPGFWLDVEWLLAASPPNDYACLQKILGKEARRKRG